MTKRTHQKMLSEIAQKLGGLFAGSLTISRIFDAVDHITKLEAQLADAKQVANDCRIVADNAIAEAKKSQWVPVSERLPEPDTDVLCYLQVGSSYRITVAGLFPIEMGAGFRSGIRSEWLEFSNPDSALSNVTHWMPLPSSPAIQAEGKA